uniref:Uncharacterized protein n=1 Tax=Rhizophora mucronata TaxID=61149 RepID=A0A2P2KDG0_RHIMU
MRKYLKTVMIYAHAAWTFGVGIEFEDASWTDDVAVEPEDLLYQSKNKVKIVRT